MAETRWQWIAGITIGLGGVAVCRAAGERSGATAIELAILGWAAGIALAAGGTRWKPLGKGMVSAFVPGLTLVVVVAMVSGRNDLLGIDRIEARELAPPGATLVSEERDYASQFDDDPAVITRRYAYDGSQWETFLFFREQLKPLGWRRGGTTGSGMEWWKDGVRLTARLDDRQLVVEVFKASPRQASD